MEPITTALLIFGARALLKLLDEVNWSQMAENVSHVATLSWQTVMSWFESKQVSAKDSGTLIKESLANGNYRIVCGVFNSRTDTKQATAWECSSMDYELSRRMHGKDKITI